MKFLADENIEREFIGALRTANFENDFAEKFPEMNNALAAWYRLMRQNDFDSIAEVRGVFSERG